jgi:ATP-dependent RNA helicase RhlE
VVNFELPNVPEDYVHRIGRTGRAGNDGEAISLVCVDEHKLLRDIERLLGRAVPKVVLKGYTPDPSIPAEPIVRGGGQRTGGRGPDRRQDGDQRGRRGTRSGGGEAMGRGRDGAMRRTPGDVAQQRPLERNGQTQGQDAQRPQTRDGAHGRTAQQPKHARVHRKSHSDDPRTPRHGRPNRRREVPALLGGNRDD